MTKTEFLSKLRAKISGLPSADIEQRISFYSEMIDDMIEEGISEQEAVLKIGSVDEVALEIIGNTPLKKIVKERIKPSADHKTVTTVLLAVGSPIWISLLAVAFSVAVVLFVSLFSVVVSVWAVFISTAISAPLGLVIATIFAFSGNPSFALLLVSFSFVSAGISIFAFVGAKELTRLSLFLSKKVLPVTKKALVLRRDKE